LSFAQNREKKETSMNCIETRTGSCIRDWCQVLIIVATSFSILQTTNASPRLTQNPPQDPPPCPKFEILCDGLMSESPEETIKPICECGPGYWFTSLRKPELNPTTPIHTSWAGSQDFVGWQTSCERIAMNGSATANVSISGTSSFWHAGSKSVTQMSQYTGGWKETWTGTFPACARSILISAVGSGGLGISDSCAARLGCSASSNASAGGMATSRGRASATLSNLQIHGTVSYDHVTQLSKIDGNFGADVAYSNSTFNGTFSSNSSWTVNGQGSATGSMSFTVLPDRTYCALTNLPIAANWTGTVVATTAVTVDDNGSAAGSAGATLTLSVN
jgi:hypothetical protein